MCVKAPLLAIIGSFKARPLEPDRKQRARNAPSRWCGFDRSNCCSKRDSDQAAYAIGGPNEDRAPVSRANQEVPF